MSLKQFALLLSLPLLGACNMVVSETPMFVEADRGAPTPRDGVWLGEKDDCRFDSSKPESEWPRCAMQVVVRNSGRELILVDSKETQRVTALFAAGTPAIIEGKWVDDAKESAKATYGYFGLETRPAAADGRFVRATLWSVECGVKNATSSEIRPFPGITAECRAAAASSRRTAEVQAWRWVRAERGAATAQASALPAFMTGCWQRRSRPEEGMNWTQECWMEPKAGLMLGASREVDGDTLKSWEQLRIERSADGTVTLFASPRGRSALPFKVKSQSSTSIEFVNASHDYPQRIRYELKDGRLEAEISLIDGKRAVTWSYNRENR